MLISTLPQNAVFGDRLRAWRKKCLGLTQAQFAEKTGVHLSAIRKYERHSAVPGGDSLVAIAITGVNLHWLLTGEGNMRAPKEDTCEGISQAVVDEFGARIEAIHALIDNIPMDRRTTVLEAMLSCAQQAKQISDLEKAVEEMKKLSDPPAIAVDDRKAAAVEVPAERLSGSTELLNVRSGKAPPASHDLGFSLQEADLPYVR